MGVAKSKTELEPLRQLCEFILAEIQQTHSPQQELFSVKEYARLLTHARQAKQAEKLGVDVGECREQARLTVGVRQAYGQLWETLGLTRVLGARRQSSNQILRELVLARIAQPRSKRGTVMDLSRDAGVTLSLDRVYQTMDDLDDRVIDKIQTLVGRYTQKVDPEGMHVVFMDCTTLYFEQDQEDELRLKGRSKDGKAHRVQIILALMVTNEGLPVGYEVFPGNLYEGKTLIQLVDDWQVRFPDGRMTVVADAGLLSADNQAALQARQIAYILGYRMSPEVVRRELNALQMSILWRPGTSDKYVMPSRATTAAKRIYRCVGLTWNTVPFALPKGRSSPPSR